MDLIKPSLYLSGQQLSKFMQSPLLVLLVNIEVEREFWFRLIMISKKGIFFLISVSKVNLVESLRRRIFEYTSSVTKVDLSSDSEQLTVKLNLECFEYVAPYLKSHIS